MGYYIHHIPGRLRIKTAVVKRSDREAERLRTLLADVSGVSGHAVNTVTGSVLITYDTTITHAEAILAFLREQGYVGLTAAPDRSEDALISQFGSSVGEALGKAVFGAVVEKIVERSAVALIGAIL